MKPSFLARDSESRLTAHLDVLPYQEATPLSAICEDGSTEVITSSSGSYSLERELFTIIAASNGENGKQHQPERNPQQERHPDDASQEELSTNVTGEETKGQRT